MVFKSRRIKTKTNNWYEFKEQNSQLQDSWEKCNVYFFAKYNTNSKTFKGRLNYRVYLLIKDGTTNKKSEITLTIEIKTTLGKWHSLVSKKLSPKSNNFKPTERTITLKGRYTSGNRQRPFFSLGVSQHKHKITSLWKCELNWSSKLRENDERKKHPCWTNLCAFR